MKCDAVCKVRGNTVLDLDTMEVCGGDFTVVVKAVDEPYFGGTYANLDVHLECQKCGNTSYLVSEYNVEAFLTAVISEMSQQQVLEIVEKPKKE